MKMIKNTDFMMKNKKKYKKALNGFFVNSPH